jgi:hypothetical protein
MKKTFFSESHVGNVKIVAPRFFIFLRRRLRATFNWKLFTAVAFVGQRRKSLPFNPEALWAVTIIMSVLCVLSSIISPRATNFVLLFELVIRPNIGMFTNRAEREILLANTEHSICVFSSSQGSICVDSNDI